MVIQEFSLTYYDRVMDLWKSSPEMGLRRSDTLQNIEKFLIRNPGFSFIALDGGEIMGTVLCGHDGRRGFLYHLFVRKQYRNQGIGKSLVGQALKKLEENGIQKCHLMVFESNKSGRSFWEKIGFVLRNDLIVMSKEIGSGAS